jgi:hypothetical protein
MILFSIISITTIIALIYNFISDMSESYRNEAIKIALLRKNNMKVKRFNNDDRSENFGIRRIRKVKHHDCA